MRSESESPTAGVPLVFVGRLDETDAVLIRRYHDRLVVRRPVRWAGGVVLTLLAAVAVWWTLAWGEYEWWAWLLAAWYVAAWSSLLLLLPLRAWEARRHYRKHQAEYLETRVSLGDDRVGIENAQYTMSFEWKSIRLVADTPEGLLFCNHAGQVFFWLPERSLAADRLRERVLALVGSSGVLVRRLT